MAYDELLLKKAREILAKIPGIKEQKMFGGIGFLLHGNMACGILNDDLIIRVGPAKYDKALNLAHARKFDITGRVMKGWVMVSGKEITTDNELAAWVQRGVSFAKTLPPK